MKKSIPSFLLGMLTMAIIVSLSVSAFAISGHMTLEVDPINIQVNGEVFAPRGYNGEEIPVFVYNGNTYAPLRPLAEAYGLKVGYDSEKNMAIVTDPDISTPAHTPVPAPATTPDPSEKETAYQEFKDMWGIKLIKTTAENEKLFDVLYTGKLKLRDFESMWLAMDEETRAEFSEKMATEIRDENPGYTISLDFKYKSYKLGYAFAYHEYSHTVNHFAPNPFVDAP